MVKTSYPKDINFFLEEVILKIKDELNPAFILIAGSFGKESWLFNKSELISDFEIVFICDTRWSIKKKIRLLKDLNRDFPYDISLKGYLKKSVERKALSNFTTKNPGYISLDFFDTFNNPKILFSKNNENLKVNCTALEIPIWEAWRLIVNRMGDLLKLKHSIIDDGQAPKYYWLKMFESIADAYCIINKVYSKDITKRIAIFRKEFIDKDIDLSEECKASFPIIYKALVSRKKHDLLLFDIDLKINNYYLIINSWMDYFEKKLASKERLHFDNKYDFYMDYSNNLSLNKKYLGFNYSFNILISNIIRIISRPKLFNINFKFYRQNMSWRHIILLTVSSAFYEESLENKNLSGTKKIASKIFRIKFINELSKEEFIQLLLNYWKILR